MEIQTNGDERVVLLEIGVGEVEALEQLHLKLHALIATSEHECRLKEELRVVIRQVALLLKSIKIQRAADVGVAQLRCANGAAHGEVWGVVGDAWLQSISHGVGLYPARGGRVRWQSAWKVVLHAARTHQRVRIEYPVL